VGIPARIIMPKEGVSLEVNSGAAFTAYGITDEDLEG
jgi:hypothetical protein